MIAEPVTLVVDASVCLKWHVPEAGSEAARAILHGGASLVAPEILVAEVANALWQKARRTDLTAARCLEIVDSVAVNAPIRFTPSVRLAPGALEIALAQTHPVYDCLYLALAGTLGVPLVTADQRLHAAVRGSRWESVV